jgi:hypothetical protein
MCQEYKELLLTRVNKSIVILLSLIATAQLCHCAASFKEKLKEPPAGGKFAISSNMERYSSG